MLESMFSLPPIVYIDRLTGLRATEQVYGSRGLALLYGGPSWRRYLISLLRALVTRLPFYSRYYGWLQRRSSSRRQIAPFVKTYGLDPAEFEKPLSEFSSFDDFFSRKLKIDARSIVQEESVAIMPADGRYRFIPDLSVSRHFCIKGHNYSLAHLLGSEARGAHYAKGAMVIARLCPIDYHRFHFPCSGLASPSQLIKGCLSSVNPVALKERLAIFTENKRMLSTLTSPLFGEVTLLEVGALAVGTIHETYPPNAYVAKGDEKGYFSFGGSALVLLFEEGRIAFDEDLVTASALGLEIRCLFGQSLGRALAV